jgi:hypothetical protein
LRYSSWAARMAAAAVSAAGLLGMGLAAPPAHAAITGAAHPTLWVSGSAAAVGGDGTGCAAPGFNAIQPAVDAAPPGATIRICSGTYAEQLVITQPVRLIGTGGPVTITLPPSPATATACASGPAPQYGVDICGPVTVTLTRLTVHSAWPAGTCNDDLNAVYVAGGATLAFDHSAVTAAGASPINGCQGGAGILVTSGRLLASDSSVSGYQKNGITLKGAGVTGTISYVKVKGAGPTPAIAQNGIEVALGARATITHSWISGNECDVASCGPDAQADYQAAGILFYGSAPGSVVSHTSASRNDIGVYTLGGPGPRATATISYDKVRYNRYEDIVLDQGTTVITHSAAAGGNVALMLIQYAGQTTGIEGTASRDTFGPAGMDAIQVYSDQASGDVPGQMTIRRSRIRGTITSNSPASAPVTLAIH